MPIELNTQLIPEVHISIDYSARDVGPMTKINSLGILPPTGPLGQDSDDPTQIPLQSTSYITHSIPIYSKYSRVRHQSTRPNQGMQFYIHTTP